MLHQHTYKNDDGRGNILGGPAKYFSGQQWKIVGPLVVMHFFTGPVEMIFTCGFIAQRNFQSLCEIFHWASRHFYWAIDIFCRATMLNWLASYAIAGPVKKYRPSNWATVAHKSCHQVANHLPNTIVYSLIYKLQGTLWLYHTCMQLTDSTIIPFIFLLSFSLRWISLDLECLTLHFLSQFLVLRLVCSMIEM